MPTPDKRLKTNYPAPISAAQFSRAIEELKAGNFPSTLKDFFSDTFPPSNTLVRNIAANFRDVEDTSKFLGALSPFQQLWLLEASEGAAREVIATYMADQLVASLTRGNEDVDPAKRAEAIKLLAYINTNYRLLSQSDARREGYDELLTRIKSSPNYQEIESLL